jgi:uncharacterized membrane protein YhfC
MSLLNLVGFAAAIFSTGVGPLAVGVWARARLRVPLRMFFIGGAFYLVQLVAQQPVWLGVRAAGLHDTFLLAAVVGPAIWALFEESSRYLSWRAGRTMRENRTSNGALLAGLGHGGMESIVFTLQPIGTILVALVAPRSLPSGLAHQLLHGSNLAFYVTMVGGRVLAMATPSASLTSRCSPIAARCCSYRWPCSRTLGWTAPCSGCCLASVSTARWGGCCSWPGPRCPSWL